MTHPSSPPADQTVRDEQMVRRAQAGHAACFEELVRRYETRVYGFLFHCARNDADARDLAQATFVAAWRALPRFNPRRAFAPWLFTIARRTFIDHWRRRAATRETGPAETETADTRDPSVIVAEQEFHQNLWRWARRVLPPNQFQALWLKYRQELSVSDIARVMRKTPTHVKVLLYRARQTLLRTAPQPHRPPPAPTRPAPRLGDWRLTTTTHFTEDRP
jgi:RNA polymerase sigma-70 factor (ECF subfamily)